MTSSAGSCASARAISTSCRSPPPSSVYGVRPDGRSAAAPCRPVP
jgi:hypothetical protein